MNNKRIIAVDVVVKDNKKYLTDNLDLTDDVFGAKVFLTTQDCNYFLFKNDLERRVVPVDLFYLVGNHLTNKDYLALWNS